jgi:uncharacterized membrane protein YbhN (UPF0104 family)
MRGLKKLLFITLSCFLVLGCSFYTYQHLDDFKFIQTLSYPHLGLLIFLSFIYLYLQGVIYNQALKWFHFQLKPTESFGLLLLTMMGNYILPFSGLGLRAKYLQKKYQFDYRSFSSSLLIIFIIETLVFLFGAVLACFFANNQDTAIPHYFKYIIYSSFGAGLAFLFLKAHQIFLKYKIFSVFKSFFEEWEVLWSHHAIVSQMIIWNSCLYFIYVLMFKVSIAMFHLNLSWPGLLLVASLSNLSFMFKLTPASIGTFDGAIIFCLKIFGINISHGLMIAVLIRFSTIFWVICATPFTIYISLGGKNFFRN